MWVEVEKGRLFVETAGHGPPLLMVHGWPLDHRLFGPQREALCSSFTVITYDRRGFGRSEAQPDLRLELDDIDHILDALGFESTHLLGMSQGGRIAIRYAVTRSERLRSMILQGAVIDDVEFDDLAPEHVPLAEFATLASDGRLDEVRRRWLDHPMMTLGPAYKSQSALLRRMLDEYAGTDLISFDPESYVFDMDVPAALDSLTLPTLVITGSDETAVRKRYADEILARVRGARGVQIDGGHLCNLTAPDAYNQAARDFCLAVEAERSRYDAALSME